MSDFPTVWQNYFTALDELAKAVVASRDASAAHEKYIQEYARPIHGVRPFPRSLADWGSLADADGDALAALDDAEGAFYEAHLALKPFLEDDSE